VTERRLSYALGALTWLAVLPLLPAWVAVATFLAPNLLGETLIPDGAKLRWRRDLVADRSLIRLLDRGRVDA